MTVIAPVSATRSVAFLVIGMVDFHNNGPAPTVNADVTFSLLLPPDCTASSPTTVTVFNVTVPMSVFVSVSRSWKVTCTQPGDHEIPMNASLAISPLQLIADPNLANNSGSGAGTTQVN